jgi:succinate dehydrogenase / fumarate reductase membrane anchor subunit
LTLRSPLARARGLGSAKTGTGHFWWQRVTAAALIPLTLILAVSVLRLTGAGFDEARAAIGHPFTATMFLLFLPVAFWHLKLGLDAVIEDYVHAEVRKLALKISNIGLCAAVAAGSMLAVLKLLLGG